MKKLQCVKKFLEMYPLYAKMSSRYGGKMKFQKTKNRYVAKRNPNSSNGWGLTYYPETQDAYSYGWWRFAKKFKDIMVVNIGTYSPTTTKHQQAFLNFYHLKGKVMTVDIGRDSLDSLDDLITAMSNNVDKIKENLEGLSRSNKNYCQTNRVRILTIIRLVEKTRFIAETFDLTCPDIPSEAEKLWAYSINTTGQVKVGNKVYNFYNGQFTSPDNYVKLTSKLGELL